MGKKVSVSGSGLTGFLYNRVGYFIIGFFLFALLAFWTSYYGVLSRPMPGAVHFHGATMTIWCLLLISQAMLIRRRHFKMHRLAGRLSYVIVPLIVFSGLHLSRQTVSGAAANPDLYYHLIALMYNAVLVFIIFYGLAMWHRKTPAVHARYMICTLLPLMTPVTDRIIHKYIHDLVPHLPTIGGAPIAPIVGYALADLIVLVLLIWDWRAHKRLNVFPIVLGILLLYHISVMTFYQFDVWRGIGDWMMRWPVG